MRRITWASLLAAAAAVSCASGGPVPMGRDTYQLSGTGAWSWSSGAALKGDMFREADTFCRGQGKQMQPVNTASNDGSFQRFAQAELQFRCLAPGDPELGRPTLEPVPTVRIENRTK